MAKLPSRLVDKNVRITNEAHKLLVDYTNKNPVKIGKYASQLIVNKLSAKK